MANMNAMTRNQSDPGIRRKLRLSVLWGPWVALSMPKPLSVHPGKGLPAENHLGFASMAFRHSFGAAAIEIAITITTILGAQMRRTAAINRLGLTTTIQPTDPAIAPTIKEATWLRTCFRFGGILGLVRMPKPVSLHFGKALLKTVPADGLKSSFLNSAGRMLRLSFLTTF